MESLGGNTMNASEFSSVSTKQQRIAQLAKQSPEMVFTSLAYHMDIEWLEEAYRRTKKNGAAGVDGVTAKEYEANLQEVYWRELSQDVTKLHLLKEPTFQKGMEKES
jgi:hypothetical protein